ncbi:nucleotidyltransferase family protein isoform X2 [Tasmannia lanceolata]|uniref:nucleotidyltransferase family protein isoform X2 n=1 Tax=Tasmannia lanceolata TaxID=3420 RepID=UPI004062C00B
MDSNQLIDSLTAHIALYHSSTLPTNPKNSNPRNSILRWFSSLTIPQRQSFVTILDPKFVQILLQMQNNLHNHGHGFFIILPDLPSRSNPSLPSLCFRKSTGLLSRVSKSNELELSISHAIRLFGSKEEESCSICSIDSVTVSEEFVGDLDRFVRVMDGVSDGGFLRGEEQALGSDWEELPWLKAKGYYSVEAFVANKMELTMRLSWLSCYGPKKRGLKMKGCVSGVAANVFWRKKGCLDWWDSLDPGLRKKLCRVGLGKAAKSLANEIVREANEALKDDLWSFNVGAEQPLRYGPTALCQGTIHALSGTDADLCSRIVPASISGKPTQLANAFNRLLVIREISAMILTLQQHELEKEKLFFSTLGSVHTFSDCLSRRLRGFLVAVSGDYIKHELLGDENLKAPINKSKEKLGVGCRKGRKKNRNSKRLNSMPNALGSNIEMQNPSEEHGCGSVNIERNCSRPSSLENDISLEANDKSAAVSACIPEKDLHKQTSLTRVGMENSFGVVDCKIQIAGKKSRKKSNKSNSYDLEGPTTVGNPKVNIMGNTSPPISVQSEPTKCNGLLDASIVHHLANDFSVNDNPSPGSTCSDPADKPNVGNDTEVTKKIQEDSANAATSGSSDSDLECFHISKKLDNSNIRTYDSLCSRKDIGIPHMEASFGPGLVNSGMCSDAVIESCCITSSIGERTDDAYNSKTICPFMPVQENVNVVTNKGFVHHNSGYINNTTSEPALSQKEGGDHYDHGHPSSVGGKSYEWPSLAPSFSSSEHLPAATDRLHLDVGHNWCNHLHQSFVPARHQALNPSMEGGCSRVMAPRTLTMSLDWPPMIRSSSRLTTPLTCNYDTGIIPRLQPSFNSGFTAHGRQLNGTKDDNEKRYTGDFRDCDIKTSPDLVDDSEPHWMTGEESEVHAFSGRDYNQFFGGGVMYWNTSDHAVTGFSRPPSLSSEDSSWAWHEADLNRAIDDMVGLPGLPASFSANGLASPPAGQFCSPFDPLGPGHQPLGYVMPGNDVTGKVVLSSSTVPDVPEEKGPGSLANSPGVVVEGMTGDPHPYPILRPIIVPNISRKGSRSEFKFNHDHKSPCVPPTRREVPQIKRPPSPVVLCVPQAPRPPPPSPVSGSRKQRGFPAVRSGSSSPRHWGMRSWYHDGTNCGEARLCVDGAEVIWPSWRNKGMAATQMIQPLPGSLLQDRLIAISQLALDQEHPDVAFPLQPPDLQNSPAREASLAMMHNILHGEINSFCEQVAAENLIKKPYINWAVKRVARSLQVLWPRSRTNIFGSNATGLALPISDVDLVVCLPPVRNLEPIKEAGILEGRNGIKETCLQHAARYLANQEWVKNDSLKTIENTAIPVIMLVAEVPHDLIASSGNTSIVDTSKVELAHVTGEEETAIHFDIVGSDNAPKMKNDDGKGMESVRLDISFKSTSHTGLQTTELVRELTEQFPAVIPLALVLKQFLADRSLDHSYSGGLSSYCLVLLITRFLQHEHHIGRPMNQNLGSLLMDFLYFFGNVFDPRQMRISIQGSGIYVNRERGQSIDPIHIDDPLYPTNNIGRNCFRIHQCIKMLTLFWRMS